MAKQHKIRWRESDELELKKAVRNFNDKIKRLEKKYNKIEDATERRRMLATLPEKVSYKELRRGVKNSVGVKQDAIIQTRKGLKFELKSLQGFTERGAEKAVKVKGNENGLLLTKWQVKDLKKRARRATRERTKRLDEMMQIPAMSRGQQLGYTKGELGMGKQAMLEYNPINAFTPTQTMADIRKKARTLRKEAQPNYWSDKDEQWVNDYTRTLLEELGAVPEVQEIVERIKGLSLEEFKNVMYSEVGIQEYSYPRDSEGRKESINQLRSIWLKDADLYN